MSLSLPTLLAAAFAHSGDKNTIPSASASPAASLYDGFPTITSQLLSAGGVPPDRKDFNGILNTVTALLVWMNSGKPFPFNSTLSTALGGYDKGALLILDDNETLVQSTADSNTTNPNSSMTGWKVVNEAASTFAHTYNHLTNALTIANNSSAMVGLGLYITPESTGEVHVSVTGPMSRGTTLSNTTPAEVQVRYGTGTAPVAGASATGSTGIGGGRLPGTVPPESDAWDPDTFVYTLMVLGHITGLTPGTTYWIDLLVTCGASANAVGLYNLSAMVEEV